MLRWQICKLDADAAESTGRKWGRLRYRTANLPTQHLELHSAGGGERQYGRSLSVVEMANCAVSLCCEMGDACRLAGRWDCSGVRGNAPLRGPQHILPPQSPLDTTTTNVPTARYASGEQNQHTYPHSRTHRHAYYERRLLYHVGQPYGKDDGGASPIILRLVHKITCK